MADIFDELDIFDEVAAEEAPPPQEEEPLDLVGIPAEAPTKQVMAEGLGAIGEVADIPFKPLHWVKDAATGLMKKVPILNQPFQPAAAEAGVPPEPEEGAGTTLADIVPQVAEFAAVPAYAKGMGAVGRAVASPVQTYARASRALGREAYIGSEAAERMYASALKPLRSLTPEQRTELFQTGLGIDEIMGKGIPISRRKANAVKDMTDSTLREMDDIFAIGTREGVNLDVDRITNPAKELANRYKRAGEDVSDIENRIARIREQFPSGKIPIEDARQIKSDLFQLIRDKYGEFHGLVTEARKALAHGIVEESAKYFPELAELGEKSRRLINYENAIERRLATIGRNELIGAFDPITLAAGKGPGAVIVLARRILEHPDIKSRLAIALANRGVPNPMNVIKARMIAARLGDQRGGMSISSEQLPAQAVGGEEMLPGGVWEKPWMTRQREQTPALAPAPNTAGLQAARDYDMEQAILQARALSQQPKPPVETVVPAPSPANIPSQASRPSVSPGPEPVIPPRAPVIVHRPGTAPESSKVGAPLIRREPPTGKAKIPPKPSEGPKAIKDPWNMSPAEFEKSAKTLHDISEQVPGRYQVANIMDAKVRVANPGETHWALAERHGVRSWDDVITGFIDKETGEFVYQYPRANLEAVHRNLVEQARKAGIKTGRTKEEAQKRSKGWAKRRKKEAR